MKNLNIRDLPILDANPAFQKTIPVGQLNFPAWERFESTFRDIFSRQYYTNQGPLANELEARLRDFLGVKHVVCMTNATIALMIAAKALDLKGKVICPAFTFVATAQSITWAGLEPVFCDVNPKTHQMSVENVATLIDDDVSAILGVHLWGNPCNLKALQELAQKNDLQIYFDAAQAFGNSFSGVAAGNFGDLEVFSFHATNVLNATEGGCVCTNDDYLASRLRNIRSSYGAGSPVSIPLTGNGRMSEAQAAMALLSFEDYPQIRERNEAYFKLYDELLSGISGIRIIRPDANNTSNYQFVVLEISPDEFGLSRDLLLKILKAENISSRKCFSPGLHKTIPYCHDFPKYLDALPITDQLCERVIQLPSGQDVTPDCIYTICEVIKSAHEKKMILRSSFV